MEEIMKIKKLFDFGIPISVIARECHCSPVSIRNYLSGASLPNGSKQIAMKDGLNHLLDVMIKIIKE